MHAPVVPGPLQTPDYIQLLADLSPVDSRESPHDRWRSGQQLIQRIGRETTLLMPFNAVLPSGLTGLAQARLLQQVHSAMEAGVDVRFMTERLYPGIGCSYGLFTMPDGSTEGYIEEPDGVTFLDPARCHTYGRVFEVALAGAMSREGTARRVRVTLASW
jgi:hypothetical protein